MATAGQRGSDRRQDSGLAAALELIRLLAVEIGPRRPCSKEERAAAEALAGWLEQRSIPADLQDFRGYSSGGYSHGLIFGTALAGALAQRRRPVLGGLTAAAALGAAALEADTRWRPVSDLLSRSPSTNLTASVAPREAERRRLVLVGHMDSTRSGLVFHPELIGQLERIARIPPASTALVVLASLLRRRRAGAWLRRAGIAGLLVTLAALVERELAGEDVAGANDNASGTAVAMQLAAELAERPLRHTRVDLLITGCEEAWSLGAEAYLDALAVDPAPGNRPIFLNFDTVAGPGVPLTYIEAEGMLKPMHASRRLIDLLERIALERPDLDLRSARGTPGFPTDVTAALARGYEGVTLLAQGEDFIPNYHWPSDTYENVDPDTVWRTLETGRALLAELDREVGSGPND